MRQTEEVMRQLDEKVMRLGIFVGELQTISDKVRELLEEIEREERG